MSKPVWISKHPVGQECLTHLADVANNVMWSDSRTTRNQPDLSKLSLELRCGTNTGLPGFDLIIVKQVK